MRTFSWSVLLVLFFGTAHAEDNPELPEAPAPEVVEVNDDTAVVVNEPERTANQSEDIGPILERLAVMSSRSAAKVVAAMPLDLAARVVLALPAERGGRLLQVMKPHHAAQILQKMDVEGRSSGE